MKATKLLPIPFLRILSPIAKKPTSFCFSISTYNETSIPPQISSREPLDFAKVLTFSASTNSPFLGSATHSRIIKLGFSNDIFINNYLVLMYSRCQYLEQAINLFGEMPQRTVVSWTSMISGCIRSSEHEIGLQMYLEMMRSGFYPNEYTLASVLSACAVLEAIKLGSSLHSVAFKMGCERNPFVGCSLLSMYAKCRNIEAAEMEFECIDHPDLACWNAMVESYAFGGYSLDAMRIVYIMRINCLPADRFTFVSALKACSVAGLIHFGQQMHSFIIHLNLESSTLVMNSLMDMYFKFQMIDHAVGVFDRMPEKDIVSWNVVICGFAQAEDEKKVFALFSSMLYSGLKPNQVTLPAIFRLRGVGLNLCLGLQLCCFTYHLGLFNHAHVVNALINMFSRCGLMDKANLLFSSHGSRSTDAYNEMIEGYNFNGYYLEALCMFCSLTRSGLRSNEFTYTGVLSACRGTKNKKVGEQIHASIIKSGFNSHSYICTSLIDAYGWFRSSESSYKIFQGVRVLDLASWGAMIASFARQGLNFEAFSLFSSLREVGESPDEFILASILNSCASSGVLDHCRSTHSLVVKTGFDTHLHVASAVCDAYAKCGDIGGSRMVFDCVSGDKDAVLLNTMITAFAHHGMIGEAIQVIERMRHCDLLPTQATFVAVISACRHLGLVEEGQFVFDSMSSVYGMLPSKDNFGCLVDLLARKGLIQKAKNVIDSMPYEPWPAVWRSLLSGCRIHGEKIIAREATEKLRYLQCDDGALALLSNMYAEAGRWEDAADARMRFVEQGVHKLPGYSVVGL